MFNLYLVDFLVLDQTMCFSHADFAHNQCQLAPVISRGFLPFQRPFYVMTLPFQHCLTPLIHVTTLLTQRMIDSTGTLHLDKIIHVNPLPPLCLCRVTWSGPLQCPITLHPYC